MAKSEIKKAFNIAVDNLRSNYHPNGITAGYTHFSDYWLRDMCYASFGAVEIQDYEIVKKGFDFFLNTQNEEGFVAFRTGINAVAKYFLSHIFGVHDPIDLPRWINDKIAGYVIDTFPMMVIGIANYVRKSKDKEYAIKVFEKLEISMNHYFSSHIKDGLIEEVFYAHWADSIKKSGKTLYTNVLYCKALADMSYLANLCNECASDYDYRKKHLKVKKTINDVFWRHDHYADWITDKIYDYFTVDANMLAVIWGIAEPKKCRLICEYLLSHEVLYNPVPCKTNYPKYPDSFEYIGLSWFLKYHNLYSGWLWLGCVSAVALEKEGYEKEAKAFMKSIARKINEYGVIYEIYDDKGRPYRNLFYQSEKKFAWSSGMFIWACKKLKLV